MRNFRFKVNGTIVTPIWGDGAAKVQSLEEGEEYYRTSLSADFTFMGADFTLIEPQAFNTEFTFLVELDTGGGYVEYFTGFFYRKHCIINYEINSISVKPLPDDEYRLLLEGKEKEFNLIDYSPARYKLKYLKQGVLQVWTYPSNYMTNIVRGNYWVRRVDILERSSVKINEKYKFGFKSPTGTTLFVPGTATELNPDVGGYYSYDTYERTSDSLYQFIGVGSGTLAPYEVNFYDNLPTEDPNGFANLRLYLDATTLHDFDDFGGVWSIGGVNITFLGILYDDIAGQYEAYFRGDTLSTAPASGGGTILYVSGGTNPDNQTYTDWVFRWYEKPTGLLDNPYSHEQSGGGTVDPSRWIHNVRWAIYESAVPTLYNYAYLSKTTATTIGGLTTYQELDQEGALFHTLVGTTEQCRLVFNIFYQRLLSDKESIGGVALEAIDPAEDVQGNELGYKFALPKEYDDFEVTDLNTATQTRYGKFNEGAANFGGLYFDEFTSGNQTIPLNQPDWKEASVWMDVGAGKLADIAAGDTVRELRHSYKLAEVIELLLAEIDPTLTFLEDVAHSDFLFNATNPISGETQPELFISPKSNVIQGEYSNEASKAIITLDDILKTLRIMYDCRWHIDSSNRFRIEHKRWYNNGGHYITPQVSTDLTTQRDYKTRQLWSEGLNEVSYEETSFAETTRFKWMDDQSPAFDGLDIVGTDDYVEKGVTEERIITRFSSDIDYIQLEGDNISKEGFVILAAVKNAISLEYTIPFKAVTILGNWEYDLQNGYLSFMYLHKHFHKDDSPCTNLLINDQATTANAIRRTKIHEVGIPNQGVFDPIELITTDQGNGKVKTVSTEMESDYMKITTIHETT